MSHVLVLNDTQLHTRIAWFALMKWQLVPSCMGLRSEHQVFKTTLNLVPRASVAFPQKASRPADTPGKRRQDSDKFSLAQTDALRSLKLARSHRAGSVEELTV